MLWGMILLAGGASFFIGNSYQAQMPSFAVDLGHGDPGAAYTALLGADAAGALLAGLLLESGRGIFRTSSATALILATLWAAALGAFALVPSYPFALVISLHGWLLRALVQQHDPDHRPASGAFGDSRSRARALHHGVGRATSFQRHHRGALGQSHHGARIARVRCRGLRGLDLGAACSPQGHGQGVMLAESEP